jgi:lambda repressor-like predicted transcriptional regulator
VWLESMDGSWHYDKILQALTRRNKAMQSLCINDGLFDKEGLSSPTLKKARLQKNV